MTEYIATTDQVTSAYLKVHGRSEEVRDELSRWFEEFSRQEREAALKDLENGRLPEGYMIVNVENLSEAVLRARKGIVTEAEALKFAAEFLRSKRFHVYKSQSGIGWMALNTINGAARALEAESKLRS